MLKYIKEYNDRFYIFKISSCENTHDEYMKNGYNHLYLNNKINRLYTYNGYIDLNVDIDFFNAYSDGDVLSINEQGIIEELYISKSSNNAICVTLQCNSNCIMCPCSEQSRKHCNIADINYIKEMVYYFPKNAEYLTITGGEPTLMKENFFILMSLLNENLNDTNFQLLTNGRAFCNKEFVMKFEECKPRKIQCGIPLYGYNDITHDAITQAEGSFKQTVMGIQNLLNANNIVEIRIVLTKQTIINIEKIVEFIIKKLDKVNSVKMMGLEMMGNAVVNRNIIWEPYDILFEKAQKTINILINAGIDVAMYNFPLCTVKKDYWGICEKSISDYKIEYNEECSECKVKDLCGGVFSSTRKVTNFKCKPIK